MGLQKHDKYPVAESYSCNNGIADNNPHAIKNLNELVTFLSPELYVIWNNSLPRSKKDQSFKTLIGQKCFKAFHDRDEPCPDCPILEVIASGVAYNEILHTPDGAYLKVSGIPIYIENRKLLGVLYISLDITSQMQAEEDLRDNTELLRGIIDHSQYFIYAKDLDGRFITVSQTLAEFLGVESHFDLVGKNSYDYFTKATSEQHRNNDLAVIKEKKLLKLEETVETDDGILNYLTIKFPLLDVNGYVHAVCGVSIDVTERIAIEEELRRSRMLLEKTEQLSKVGGWAWDVQRQEMVWTNGTYRIHEIEPEEINLTIPTHHIDRSVECYRPEDRKMILEAFNNCAEEGISYDFEVPFTSAKGRKKWVKTTAEAEYTDGVITRVIGNIMDITERKHFEETLEKLSFHDQLTGLYNRRFIEEEIKRLDTRRQLPLSVIVTDLNNLKLTNDVFGHATGDKFIKAAARVLKSSCREEDIVARWGGDEFALLLPQTDKQSAEKVYDRIINRCSKIKIDDLPLSMAIGLSVKTDSEQKTVELIKEAERNMYRNKMEYTRSTVDTVGKTLLKTLADKGYETEKHLRGVQEIAKKIAEKMNLSTAEVSRLKLLAVLHDIGKISTAEDILTKNGPLTDAEWDKVKEHPEIGFRIAKAIKDFAQVADEILAHHEHWDGTGYPRGLKGEEIPLLARIVAIADAYEVMSSGCPYKQAMSKHEIMNEFIKCSGNQFNAELVDILMQVFEEIDY